LSEHAGGSPRSGDSRKLKRRVLAITGGLALIAVVIAVGLAARQGALKAPPMAAPASGRGSVDPALEAAARAVNFHSTMNALVGNIEDKPANQAYPVTPHTAELLPVGSIALDFSLETATGIDVSLRAFRGKAVLLEFSATWCPHCQAEASHLVKLANALATSNVSVLSVNGDGEDAASVYAFERFFSIPYQTLLDPSSRPGSFNRRGDYGTVSQAYKLKIFPTFYVIDARGRIVWRAEGEQPDALLTQELHAAF
jgi:peroxiredoxin